MVQAIRITQTTEPMMNKAIPSFSDLGTSSSLVSISSIFNFVSLSIEGTGGGDEGISDVEKLFGGGFGEVGFFLFILWSFWGQRFWYNQQEFL
jgi:hypothetical protein